MCEKLKFNCATIDLCILLICCEGNFWWATKAKIKKKKFLPATDMFVGSNKQDQHPKSNKTL